jgi:hypothetical protein
MNAGSSTGVQRLFDCFNIVDSGVRRNDEKTTFGTFYRTIKIDTKKLPGVEV